ncbi:MAG: hypothetical protein H5T65_07630 [Chloroflexi bacterium]|nr:hypothetical protein [Chloroflexota bacterium]
MLTELAEWPGAPLKRHNDASHLLHKLAFVADLGFRADDPGIAQVVNRIFSHQSQDGPFQVLMNIPTHFGGTGKDQWLWMLCDAPIVLYALVKFGLGEAPRVQAAIQTLVDLVRDNGWPCAAAPELGKFRGPGPKNAPCPYANLVMLKALAVAPDWRESAACHTGAETLLQLWEDRTLRKPYLFAMGTDFGKLKAPLIWYDVLHVLDVLSHFPWLQHDERLREIAHHVKAKADEQGRFTAESVWTAWRAWEFGQKRTPSWWLTLLAHRALTRMAM